LKQVAVRGGDSAKIWIAAMRNVSVNNLTATAVGKPGNVASLIQGSKDNPVETISLLLCVSVTLCMYSMDPR
jgi:hypothetical protein